MTEILPGNVVDGDHDDIDRMARDQSLDVIARTGDRRTLDEHSLLLRIVVDKTDYRVVLSRRAILQSPCQSLSCFSRADNHHACLAGGELLVPHGIPAPAQAADDAGAIAHADHADKCHDVCNGDHAQRGRAWYDE